MVIHKKSVAILGSGPAALVAADTVTSFGMEPTIFSAALKSKIGGAQFLNYRPIGAWYMEDEPDQKIWVTKFGTKEGYAQRVYGRPDAPCSWDDFYSGERLLAWSMEKAYDALWLRFRDAIVEARLGASNIHDTRWRITEYPVIFSTIPATALCYQHDSHWFESQTITVMTRDIPGELPPLDTMMYNGLDDSEKRPQDNWYRFSRFGDTYSWEYAGDILVPWANGASVFNLNKPLETNCTCFPNIHRLGRHGRWEKKALVSDVAREVSRVLLQVL